jgi:hypothetical protein
VVDRNQLAYRIHWRCKRPRISSRASDQNISGVVRRPFAVFSLAQVGTVWIKPGVKGGEIRGDTGVIRGQATKLRNSVNQLPSFRTSLNRRSRPLPKNLRPCFHGPAPLRPRLRVAGRVTLKSKKCCSLAERQPFRGDVRCLTAVPPCRGQFETGSRRATFVRRPQRLVFSSSRGDRNRFLAAPALERRQFRSRICFRSVSAREGGPDWLTVCN